VFRTRPKKIDYEDDDEDEDERLEKLAR